MLPTSPLPAAALAMAAAAASGAPEEASVAAAGAKRKAAKASASRSKAANPVETAIRNALPGLTRALGLVRSTASRRTSAAGYASAAATASKTSSLAFLKDPKLSIEDKLIKLMGYLNAKWEKEMQDKLDKIAAGEAAAASASTSTSTSKTKKKGILGGIASAFTDAFGGASKALDLLKVPAVKTALKKLGGPVLAAAASALGFPAAAPALLKYGPTVVDAALGVASAASGAATKTSQATSGSAAMKDSDKQTIMMEVQRIQQKQQEMFGLVSNILKSSHDGRMSIIGNIR